MKYHVYSFLDNLLVLSWLRLVYKHSRRHAFLVLPIFSFYYWSISQLSQDIYFYYCKLKSHRSGFEGLNSNDVMCNDFLLRWDFLACIPVNWWIQGYLLLLKFLSTLVVYSRIFVRFLWTVVVHVWFWYSNILQVLNLCESSTS